MKTTSLIIATLFLTTTLCPVSIVGSTPAPSSSTNVSTLAPAVRFSPELLRSFTKQPFDILGFPNVESYQRAVAAQWTVQNLFQGQEVELLKEVDWGNGSVRLHLVGFIINAAGLPSLLYSQDPRAPYSGIFSLGKYFEAVGSSDQRKPVFLNERAQRIGVDTSRLIYTSLLPMPVQANRVEWNDASNKWVLKPADSAEATDGIAAVISALPVDQEWYDRAIFVQATAKQFGFESLPLVKEVDAGQQHFFKFWLVGLQLTITGELVALYSTHPAELFSELAHMFYRHSDGRQDAVFMVRDGETRTTANSAFNPAADIRQPMVVRFDQTGSEFWRSHGKNDRFKLVDQATDTAVSSLASVLSKTGGIQANLSFNIDAHLRVYQTTMEKIRLQTTALKEIIEDTSEYKTRRMRIVLAAIKELNDKLKSFIESIMQQQENTQQRLTVGDWLNNQISAVDGFMYTVDGAMRRQKIEILGERVEDQISLLSEVRVEVKALRKILLITGGITPDLIGFKRDQLPFIANLLTAGANGDVGEFIKVMEQTFEIMNAYADSTAKSGWISDFSEAQDFLGKIQFLKRSIMQGVDRLLAHNKNVNQKDDLSHLLVNMLTDDVGAISEIHNGLQEKNGTLLTDGADLLAALIDAKISLMAPLLIVYQHEGHLSKVSRLYGGAEPVKRVVNYATQLSLQQSI